jgi:arginyl-tRNA synthetase
LTIDDFVKSALDILNDRITEAMVRATGRQDCAAIVRLATDPKFGDYQANGVMALAKQLKTNPRKLAEQVVAQLDLSDLCEPPEIAGPGFINLRLKPQYIAGQLLQINGDPGERLGIAAEPEPRTIVVDFSSPNIAKEMHVGHLRSTIIGDCICRLLEFQGHTAIRQNHIGDWGTQFGKVILALWHICMAESLHGAEKPYYIVQDLIEETRSENSMAIFMERVSRHQKDWEADSKHDRGDGELYFHPFLESFSQRGKTLWPDLMEAYKYVSFLDQFLKGSGYKIPTRRKNKNNEFIVEDIDYASLSRHITAMLQQGGPDNEQEREAWGVVRRLTLDECNKIYERLTVQLTDEDVRGESFYNDMLPSVVEDLQKIKDPEGKPIAIKSDGAVCVFPPGFKTKEGEPLPFIIQKSDGAYLYATTDLAALRYRVNVLQADLIVYITDSRQIQHFQMLFKVAEMAGWDRRDGKKVELVHVPFGSVLGENGKPLKTRSGENVKLKELLDEAVERARAVVEEKNPDLPPAQKAKIAEAVGVGAVKYADYSNNRTSDYVFSFGKMLAMDGNTAPYMQYAYARVKSIERKAESKGVSIPDELRDLANLDLSEPTELDLGKHLVRYAEAIESAAADYRPNCLTAYLYELAQRFSAFYTECPVLDAPPAKRPTRLLLCDLTAKTIKHGLSQLLGIQVVKQM